MIRIPRFKVEEVVYIDRGNNIEPVRIQATLIHVEDQEVHYKVTSEVQREEEFVVDEDDILQGYESVPCPAFTVGDFITFQHTILRENTTEFEIREGVVEEVNISFDERGYHVYYKTDEHADNQYVLEDDIIEKDMPELEEEKDNYGIIS